MINNKKSTISKRKKTAANSGEPKNRQRATRKKGYWIIFPIGIMVITCISLVITKAYALNHILTPSFYAPLWFPPLPSLFIAIFGVIYIYRTLQRKFIGNLARVIAYILLVVFIIFICIIATIVAGKGHLCGGFSGVPIDCSEVNAVTLYVLFANPLSLTLLSSLAVIGSVAFLAKPKSES